MGDCPCAYVEGLALDPFSYLAHSWLSAEGDVVYVGEDDTFPTGFAQYTFPEFVFVKNVVGSRIDEIIEATAHTAAGQDGAFYAWVQTTSDQWQLFRFNTSDDSQTSILTHNEGGVNIDPWLSYDPSRSVLYTVNDNLPHQVWEIEESGARDLLWEEDWLSGSAHLQLQSRDVAYTLDGLIWLTMNMSGGGAYGVASIDPVTEALVWYPLQTPAGTTTVSNPTSNGNSIFVTTTTTSPASTITHKISGGVVSTVTCDYGGILHPGRTGSDAAGNFYFLHQVGAFPSTVSIWGWNCGGWHVGKGGWGGSW